MSRRVWTVMLSIAAAVLVLVPGSALASTAPTPVWTQESPSTSPSVRLNASMAYDSGTGQLVMFGGSNSTTDLGDTSLVIVHRRTGQLVLFGGNVGEPVGDTWVWNGGTWISESPAQSPPPRVEASMDYDAATGQLILWGGEGASGSLLTDTEEWNGFTWTPVAGGIPPGRICGSMSFDEGTGQLVLFGGEESGASLGADTWAWAPVLRSQTASFTSTAPAETVGGPTYIPTASGGGSGDAVTFSVDAATTNAACTIGSGVVSFLAGGSCVIDANQAGNAVPDALVDEERRLHELRHVRL